MAASAKPEETKNPKSHFSEELGMEMVKIIVGVGAAQETFNIHKALLCSKAPVFEKMFTGEFIEGQTQTATLPDDSSSAFKFFVTWVYRDVVQTLESHKGNLRPHIELFSFSEKYCIGVLADLTMNAIIESCKAGKLLPNLVQLELGYKLTHETSKLRLFLSRTWAWSVLRTAEGVPFSTKMILPHGPDAYTILEDSIKLLRPKNTQYGTKFVALTDPREGVLCDYHQHGKDQDCSAGSW